MTSKLLLVALFTLSYVCTVKADLDDLPFEDIVEDSSEEEDYQRSRKGKGRLPDLYEDDDRDDRRRTSKGKRVKLPGLYDDDDDDDEDERAPPIPGKKTRLPDLYESDRDGREGSNRRRLPDDYEDDEDEDNDRDGVRLPDLYEGEDGRTKRKGARKHSVRLPGLTTKRRSKQSRLPDLDERKISRERGRRLPDLDERKISSERRGNRLPDLDERKIAREKGRRRLPDLDERKISRERSRLPDLDERKIAREREWNARKEESLDDSHCLPICSPDFKLDCTCIAEEETIDCTDIDLDGADICLAPKAKKFMTKIKELRMSQNDISFIRKQGILIGEDPANVNNIDLSKNVIGHIEDKAFEEFYNLEQLDLKFNYLSVITRETFTGLYSLKDLDLRNNKIENLTYHAFSPLNNLAQLFLDFNPIKTINDRAFSGLTELEYLSLDHTGIATLNHEWFKDMHDLKTLSLQGNNFMVVPPLKGLKNLHVLTLTNNPLTEIPPHAFKLTPRLRELHINKLDRLWLVDQCAFCGLKHLQMLDINDNKILSFFDSNAFNNKEITKLNHFDIRNSHIQKLSQDLLPWEKVTNVYFAGNRWHCDCNMRWMLELKKNMGPNVAICATPSNLAGKDIRLLETSDLVCSYGIGRAARIFIAVLIMVLIIGAMVLIWYFYFGRPGGGTKRIVNIFSSKPHMPKYAYRNLAMNAETDEIKLVHDKDVSDKDEDQLYPPPASV